MGAVEPKPVGRGRGVHPFDGVGEEGAVRKPPIGLQGERDSDGEADGTGGPHDADRLPCGGERVGGGEIGPGLGERLQLRAVVGTRRVGIHVVGDHVAIPPWADHPAHGHVRQPVGIRATEVGQEGHRSTVHPGQGVRVPAQQGSPVGIGAQVGVSSSRPAAARTANAGRSTPWWKTRSVSIPPSVTVGRVAGASEEKGPMPLS